MNEQQTRICLRIVYICVHAFRYVLFSTNKKKKSAQARTQMQRVCAKINTKCIRYTHDDVYAAHDSTTNFTVFSVIRCCIHYISIISLFVQVK